LLAVAPEAVDILAQGGDTLAAFKNGFIQAIVLAPLIGLSQATTLRDHTRRLRWWFAANLTTTYLLGAAAYQFGRWPLDALSISKEITPAFPLLGFLIYGVWVLWVTAPEATAVVRPSWAGQGRHRTADPDIPD
jgi:hypothetical protein